MVIKSSLRKRIRLLHLWFASISGIVIFIVCITGCIYTFQKEIKLLVYPYYTVTPSVQSNTKLSLEKRVHAYEKQSNYTILRIYDFKTPSRSTILLTTKDDVYYYAYLNPYTGDLLFEKPLHRDFFTIVLYLHMNLLLGTIGSQIVGWSVFIFIASLISGLILWFPKRKGMLHTKKGRRASFSIKARSSKKRLYYDLHKILGFYAASILIILAITGIAWTFTWVDHAIYTLVTFEKKEKEHPITIDQTTFKKCSLDTLKQYITPLQKDKKLCIYFLPHEDTAPLWAKVATNDDQYGSTDDHYANPYNGTLITSKFDEQKNAGQKLNSLYYDIHTGSILGIGGKILVFIAGLIGASLPITGFMLYRYRRKKRNPNV